MARKQAAKRARHYHLFTLSVGKTAVERVYVEMGEPDEPRFAAEATLKRSQRNRVIEYAACHPTSWWLKQEAEGTVRRRVTRARG